MVNPKLLIYHSNEKHIIEYFCQNQPRKQNFLLVYSAEWSLSSSNGTIVEWIAILELRGNEIEDANRRGRESID